MKKKMYLLFLTVLFMFISGCECKHEYVKTERVDPTCEEEGFTESIICTKCGNIYLESRKIESLDHDLVIDWDIAATCTDPGITKGNHCQRCGKIIIQQEFIPPKGHEIYTDEMLAPTCWYEGKTEGQHCSTCGIIITPQEIVPKTEHNAVLFPGKEATCTDTGMSAATICSVCNTVIIEREVLPKIEHNVVLFPGEEATCTETGLSDGSICSVCNTVIIEREILPKKEHTLVGMEEIPSTCIIEGRIGGKECRECGKVIEKSKVIAKTNHDFIIIPETKKTCTENGKTSGKVCQECGLVLEEQVIINASHEYANWETISEATLVKEGSKRRECLVCKEIEFAVIPKLEPMTCSFEQGDALIAFGDSFRRSISITANVTGGSGEYKYYFVIYKNNSRVASLSSSNENYNIFSFSISQDYAIRVMLRVVDSQGNSALFQHIVSSYYGTYPDPDEWTPNLASNEGENIQKNTFSGIDVNPPQVDTTNLKISQTTAKAGDIIGYSIKITDESEITGSMIMLQAPVSKDTKGVSLNYNAITKCYEGEFEVTDKTENGKWIIAWIYVQDSEDHSELTYNTQYRTYSNSTNMSKGSFTVSK